MLKNFWVIPLAALALAAMDVKGNTAASCLGQEQCASSIEALCNTPKGDTVNIQCKLFTKNCSRPDGSPCYYLGK